MFFFSLSLGKIKWTVAKNTFVHKTKIFSLALSLFRLDWSACSLFFFLSAWNTTHNTTIGIRYLQWVVVSFYFASLCFTSVWSFVLFFIKLFLIIVNIVAVHTLYGEEQKKWCFLGARLCRSIKSIAAPLHCVDLNHKTERKKILFCRRFSFIF